MVLNDSLHPLTSTLANEQERIDDVVSRATLTQAIQSSFKRKNDLKNLDGEVAEELAEHVLNFFGFGDRIIDNMLKTDDRDIFYMLEDLGILKTEREETTLYDGREWRINYWTLKKNYIFSITGKKRSERGLHSNIPDLKLEDEQVYEDLPDDFWHRE